MIGWLAQFFPCSGKRQTPESPPKALQSPYEIKLIDEATMFPSVQIPENYLNSDRQPDSENIEQSCTESSESVTPPAGPAGPLPGHPAAPAPLTQADLSHCTLCQKPAEGFCCACKTDKFCLTCFEISHKSLPRYHLYFTFKQSTLDSSISQKVSSLTQKLARNRTNL